MSGGGKWGAIGQKGESLEWFSLSAIQSPGLSLSNGFPPRLTARAAAKAGGAVAGDGIDAAEKLGEAVTVQPVIDRLAAFVGVDQADVFQQRQVFGYGGDIGADQGGEFANVAFAGSEGIGDHEARRMRQGLDHGGPPAGAGEGGFNRHIWQNNQLLPEVKPGLAENLEAAKRRGVSLRVTPLWGAR